jgi:Fic family protein
MLPNPHLLIGPFLRREAVSSSRIEGTVTNLEQLLLFEADPSEGDQSDDRREVSNYVRALRYGLDRLRTLPVSLRLIREVHERLMSGVRGEEKRPGEFRDRQNMIARPGQHPGEARFVPPPVGAMREALDAFERFIAYPSGLPVLVELALIHYQFEAIHPFLDGNGRLGRVIVSLLLCERGCLTQPLLYLSAYFERHKDTYMDHLLGVSRTGDWVAWINFFLEGVAAQSRMAVSRCNELLDLWNSYRVQAQGLSNSSSLLLLIDKLFDTPAMTISQVAEALKLTFRAAYLNIERLEKSGVLVEVTNKPRNRIYMAPKIIEILEKPDERYP